MAGANRAWLDGEAGHSPKGAIGQHVVQQDAVDTPEQQVAVRMHVVVVGHRPDAVGLLRVEQRLVCNRAREGRDGAPLQVGQATEPRAIRRSNGEHFLKRIVGNRHFHRATAPGRVFDATEADVEVTARDRLIELRERDLHELRGPAERARDEVGDLDVEAHHMRRVARIGFDERRAALCVAAPPQGRLRGGRRSHQDGGTEKHRDRARARTGYHVGWTLDNGITLALQERS